MPRPRLRLLLATFLVLSLQLGAGAGDAHAYAAHGRPWPGGTITFWSTLPASYAWSTNVAIRAWNTSGARVRFVRASSARRAQLRIRYGLPPGEEWQGGAAQAQLGYFPGRQSYLSIGSSRALPMGDWDQTARLMAHELGHVVGLNHWDPDLPECAIMKTYLNQCQYADPPRAGYWYCRMLFRDDINGAIRLYGRRARPAGTPNYCPVIPAPKQLVGARATGGELNTVVRLEWTNPGLRVGDRILIEVHGVSCATKLTNLTRVKNDIVGFKATGWTDQVSATRAAASYCYVVQAVNYFGLGAPPLRFDRVLTAAPPTIGTLVENPSPESDYDVQVTLAADRHSLVVRRAPSGACVSSADQGDDVSAFSSDGSNYSLWDIPAGAWCLSFFASDFGATTSTAVTREVVHVD